MPASVVVGGRPFVSWLSVSSQTESRSHRIHTASERTLLDDASCHQRVGECQKLALGSRGPAYTASDKRSSSQRRSRTGRATPSRSRPSHIPSRLDFHGGTGFVTPY